MIEMTPFYIQQHGQRHSSVLEYCAVPLVVFFYFFLKVYPIHCINASLYRYIIGDSHTRCINRSRLSRSSDHGTRLIKYVFVIE